MSWVCKSLEWMLHRHVSLLKRRQKVLEDDSFWIRITYESDGEGGGGWGGGGAGAEGGDGGFERGDARLEGKDAVLGGGHVELEVVG